MVGSKNQSNIMVGYSFKLCVRFLDICLCCKVSLQIKKSFFSQTIETNAPSISFKQMTQTTMKSSLDGLQSAKICILTRYILWPPTQNRALVVDNVGFVCQPWPGSLPGSRHPVTLQSPCFYAARRRWSRFQGVFFLGGATKKLTLF